ncbi:MAG: hypothetical protein K2W91_09775 [Novosphingobium sp.]|nr:hypothetical protein [Novosphingobium sp.]
MSGPWLIVSDDGVESDDELSHDGDDDDFGFFAGSGEALFEGAHGWVVLRGDQGGHAGGIALGVVPLMLGAIRRKAAKPAAA